MSKRKKSPNRLLTDALREVKSTLSRFLSLFLLSALAVSFLAGLRTTAPDMEYTADAYYDAQNLMDLHILSTLGLTEEDISTLAAQPGITSAEGGYTVDAFVHTGENDLIVKAISLSSGDVNVPRLRSGRLPETAEECLADTRLLAATNFALGDTLTLNPGDGDYKDALTRRDFTIVGSADSPLFVSTERGSASLGTGKVFAFLLLPQSAFSMEYYTDAYLRADGASTLLCYDEGYSDLMDGLTDALKPLGDQRAGLQYSNIVGEATEKLTDAQQAFNDAELETNQKLNDASAELADARVKLEDGWAELEDGRATLQRETADAEVTLEEAEATLLDAKAELDQGELDYTEGVVKLEDGKRSYADGVAELEDGKATYADGLQTLLDGEDTYSQTLDTLRGAETDYTHGMSDYRAGLLQLQENAPALTEAKRKLDDAHAQLFEGALAHDQGAAQLQQGRDQLAAGITSLYTLRDGIWATANGADPQNSILDPNALFEPYTALSKAQYTAVAGSVLPMALGTLQEQLAYLERSGAAAGDPAYDALSAQCDGLTAVIAAVQQNDPYRSPYAIPAFLQAQRAALDASQAQLDQGQTGIDAGETKLRFGWDEYEQGNKQYLEGKRAFAAGVAAAQDAAIQLTDARATLDDGWAQLRAGERELDSGWTALNDAKQKLVDGQAKLLSAAQELTDGQIEIIDARHTLDDGWQTYRDGVADLEDGKERLPRETADARRKLSNAERELRDGETDYAEGLVAYEEGRAEADEKLSDARVKLNDAKRKISEIEHCKWYILGRNTNTGYVSFQQDAERMGNLASVFPLIFFLVAALVCLTTMTRMVEEQRVQIGAMKAMGYSKSAISLKYIGYGLFTSLFGGLAGLALGCILIPTVIFNAWKILYTVGDLIIPFFPVISILSVLAAVFCVTGTAVAASFATLSSSPAALMLPKAPPAGRRVLLERIRPLWKRLSFTHKVTVRNLFRYKKRFWMTVIGIGGCTALIITGFGLRDSIFDILTKQYDEISTYSSQIGLEDDVTEDELTEIDRTLTKSGKVETWMPSYQTALSIESAARTVDGYLFAVDDLDKFADFVQFRHRLDDQPVVLPHEGAVLTEKLAALLGVNVGDTITLDGDKRVEVPVVDITENYVLHYVYLSAGCYARLYGQPPPSNIILARYTEDTRAVSDEISSSLIPLSGITTISRILETREIFSKSLESVDYAVLVIIVSAAALAFVVLYNLTNINIAERLRELATLKVLGFYDRELSAYVYRENMLLTFFGVLIGLVMGKYLHQWLVLTVEIDMLMFGRTAKPTSYLYAIILTLLFSLLVNLAAQRRLRTIDMVESLKTVE